MGAAPLHAVRKTNPGERKRFNNGIESEEF